MTKFMLITAMAVGTLAITGCKAKDAKAPASEKVVVTESTSGDVVQENVTGYTKAQYMTACKQSMTEAQCECYVDFYKSIGLKVTELGDSTKVQEAVTNMKPEKAMEMQKCMQ